MPMLYDFVQFVAIIYTFVSYFVFAESLIKSILMYLLTQVTSG